MRSMFRSPLAPRTEVSKRSPARARRHQPAIDALEGRQLMSLGQEFTVNLNSTVGSNQFHPDTAIAPNGDQVVVWTTTTDRGDFDIRAKVYDRFGTALTGEISVDTTSLDSGAPKVAIDANSNFVVVWEREQSNGDDDIMGRRFSRTGATLTGSTILTPGPETERSPVVDLDSQGNVVVAYEKVTRLPNGKLDLDVAAQIRKPDLSGAKVFNATSNDLTSETDPALAVMPDGRFAIAYESKLPADKSEIRLARFDKDGLLQGDAAITPAGGISEVEPDIDVDNFGNMVVVYQEVASLPNNGDTDFNVKAQRVASNGALGALVTVAASTTNDESDPVVALHPTNGQFVVAYEIQQSGVGRSVRVREFSASNSQLALHTDFFLDDTAPALSMNASGDYVVVYSGENVGTDDIFARRGKRA